MQQSKFDSIDKVLMIVGGIVMLLIFIHTCGSNGQLTIDYRKMKEEVQSYKVQHLADSSKLISQAINYQSEIDNKDMAIAGSRSKSTVDSANHTPDNTCSRARGYHNQNIQACSRARRYQYSGSPDRPCQHNHV
jgi:hypothetical protein